MVPTRSRPSTSSVPSIYQSLRRRATSDSECAARPLLSAVRFWGVTSFTNRGSGRTLYLDEYLPAFQKIQGVGQGLRQNASEAEVGGVSCGDPDYLWRRAKPVHEFDKVAVFGHDDIGPLPGGKEDLLILCIQQPKVSNGRCRQVKLRLKPTTKGRRELSVKPESHAARIG